MIKTEHCCIVTLHYKSVLVRHVEPVPDTLQRLTLYPWMSPFCASTGGGSHVTSSWVAVAD